MRNTVSANFFKLDIWLKFGSMNSFFLDSRHITIDYNRNSNNSLLILSYLNDVVGTYQANQIASCHKSTGNLIQLNKYLFWF